MIDELERLRNDLDPYLSEQLTFTEADRRRIRGGIVLADHAEYKKRKRIVPKLLSAVVLAAVFVLLFGIAGKQMGLPGFSLSGSKRPVAIAKLQGNTILKAFPFDFKLPSYMPFKVSKVHVSSMYLGPMDGSVNNGSDLKHKSPLKMKKKASMEEKKRIARLKKAHPKSVMPTIWYFSGHPESGNEMILSIIWKLPLKDGRGDQPVQLDNGEKGLFSSTGGSVLRWQDGKLTYQLALLGKAYMKKSAARQELLKVANSFVPFNK